LEFNSHVICDFDLETNKYAWIDEMTQHLSGKDQFMPVHEKDGVLVGDLTQDKSPLKNKRTTAMCRTYNALNNNKMPGRNCSSHD